MKKLISLFLIFGLLVMTVATVEAASDAVAVSSWETGLFYKETRDAAPVPITVQNNAAYPHFNYGKSYVVYHVDVGVAGVEIAKVSITNPIPTLLTNDEFVDIYPSWSQDGLHIAWVSEADGGVCTDDDFSWLNLWVMNSDGSNKRVVACGIWAQPSWNDDSTKVVAYNGVNDYNIDEGMQYYRDLYVIDIARTVGFGQGIERITTDDDEVMELNPDWSSNGESIAYEATDSEYIDGIYVRSLDGGTPRKVAEFPAFDPSWSPNDAKIMFVRSGGLRSIKSSCNLKYQSEQDCDLDYHASPPGTHYTDWGFGEGAPDIADLVVSDIRLEETALGSGVCHVVADIKNIGTNSAGSSDTHFYLWGGNPLQLLGTCNVARPLSANPDQAVTVECPSIEVTYNSWAYEVDTFADYVDTVSELDENNNHGWEGGLNCPMPGGGE